MRINIRMPRSARRVRDHVFRLGSEWGNMAPAIEIAATATA
ncbi:MAG: hypothetical protein OXI33_03355 [Chloroflexota bacterium]|nr:hypothetical protein [Chloroflexota bacterium]